MSKIRLGGIKALEQHAYLTSLCQSGEATLGDICSRLASDRINLSLLTYVADTGRRESITAACTEAIDGFSSYVNWKASHRGCNIGNLLTDISIISIFPHNQKLNIAGSLLGVLAKKGIRSYGLASSPSAVTTIVPSADLDALVDGLFDAFQFPSYTSPLDWRAACQSQEDLRKEVICSYREEVIKVYNVSHYSDFDLWHFALPLNRLHVFGTVLLELHELQLKMPFLVSESSLDAGTIHFTVCLAVGYRDQVRQALHRNLPGLDCFCVGPASVFFLLGPHFGDRYGIADALVKSLRKAGIPLLALSYTVSSFSLVIQGNDPNQTLEALTPSFKIPELDMASP